MTMNPIPAYCVLGVLLFSPLPGHATDQAAIATSSSTATPAIARQEHAYMGVEQLHKAMQNKSLTALGLTRHFIWRIARLDHAGPGVNSVIELNPEALPQARQRDQSRANGKAGMLLGIPVLLKDNIDTGDQMLTTAGSLALSNAPAPRDASIVTRLRQAGAIILGKTNLSEWANFRSTHATSGWSGRGGLTHNPYVLDRNACGSSAGSGAAVAAGFTTVAIGTETDGSVICPASMNGIVGIKPSLGLVSRTGIVPISHNQDTAGPMARTVADAAALLTVMAGSDPRDPATATADEHATDYRKFLDPDGLKGKRIGVLRQYAGAEPNADRVLDQAITVMKNAGAIIVDPVKLPHISDLGDDEITVLLYDFKHDIAQYLATRKQLTVHTLADLIDFNKAHAKAEMPWFGQELFLMAQKKGPLTDKAYTDALARGKRRAGPEGIDAALKADKLDALLAPSWGPAFRTDLVLGDHIVSGDPTVGGVSQPASVAGYPSITVPAGFAHGLPVGIVFMTRKWGEPTLISIASGFEQHSHAFKRPKFLGSVPQPEPAQ